jgi:hypothetical protein
MAPPWAERVRSQLRGPAEHTAEEATPGELRRSAFILVLMLMALVVLVVPVLKDLPLGRGTRTGIFAWLLVALALYWMWAGMGYRPLLLCQLLFFSAAASLITAKLLMVAVSIEGLVIMRDMSRLLIQAGALRAAANLGGMLLALTFRKSESG